MKKKTAIPPIPANFPKWCEANGVTRDMLSDAAGVSDRQARRYMEGDTPVRLAVWKAIFQRVGE